MTLKHIFEPAPSNAFPIVIQMISTAKFQRFFPNIRVHAYASRDGWPLMALTSIIQHLSLLYHFSLMEIDDGSIQLTILQILKMIYVTNWEICHQHNSLKCWRNHALNPYQPDVLSKSGVILTFSFNFCIYQKIVFEWLDECFFRREDQYHEVLWLFSSTTSAL